MSKRIAIVTRERQAEALRMASGLLLLGDEAEVFVAETLLQDDEATVAQLKICEEFDVPVYSNHDQAPEGVKLSPQDFSQRLTTFDRILPILP